MLAFKAKARTLFVVVVELFLFRLYNAMTLCTRLLKELQVQSTC